MTAAERLAELLRKLGVNAEVAVIDGTPPTLEIKSEDAARLIGHRGEAVAALQHLVRVMVHRDGGDASVIVDVDGYRDRQHAQLKQLARERAEEVKRTGRSAVLSPMSSYERRLVHVELREVDGIVTESTGDGSHRRVMIKKAE